MDLHLLMSDRGLLGQVATDLAADLHLLSAAPMTTLIGDKPVDYDASKTAEAIGTLRSMTSDPNAPLWHLQYAFCLVIYLSDRIVTWLATVVQANQVKHWFDGHATLPCFRTRFEHHLVGKFSQKSKKGARKFVVIDATTPQMFVVGEFLLAHTIVSWE